MGILEITRNTLDMLNHVEIKGERNIAAMSIAISNIKGIIEFFENIKEGPNNGNDSNNK